MRALTVLGIALGLMACGHQAVAPVADVTQRQPVQAPLPDAYVVQSGDTLFSIAWQHQLDYRVLAAINGIKPPYIIHPKQRLQLKASLTSTSTAASQQRDKSEQKPTDLVKPTPKIQKVTKTTTNPNKIG